MIRKDTVFDADKPHYYSQFWIDVAAGKREIGAGRTATVEAEPEDELDAIVAQIEDVPELDSVPEAPPAKAAKPTKAKPEPKRPEPVRPALTSLADLAKIDLMMKSSAEMDSDTVPDIEAAVGASADLPDAIVTDFDLESAVEAPPPEAEAEAEIADDEFEEDDEWGEEEGPRRGSKPSKRQRRPTRPDF